MGRSRITGGLQDYKVGHKQMCILVVRYLFQICLRNKSIITLSDLANIVRDKAKINQKGGGKERRQFKRKSKCRWLVRKATGLLRAARFGKCWWRAWGPGSCRLGPKPRAHHVHSETPGTWLHFLALRFLTCEMGLRPGPSLRRISGNP